MPRAQQVEDAREIHRRTGPTFYLATRLLPERVRRDTYVLYGFFRIADEVVDGDGPDDPAAQRARLAEIRAAVLGDADPGDPVLAAFQEVRRKRGIPAEEVEVFLDAMATDVHRRRYQTREELDAYVRGSAEAVGHMMTAVMGPEDPAAARPHAGALGEAFQLTNFLRDVGEDVRERDRIYLPAEVLAAHGVDHDQIAALRMDESVASALEAELAHVEERYRVGVEGIEYLPEDCQFAVVLAAVLYADHHRLIRERGFDVLSATPSLTRRRKLRLLARTAYHWWPTRDPVATFYAASVVSPATDRAEHPAPPGAEPTPR